MPATRHIIDELLGSAWAWDEDEDDPEGRPAEDEPEDALLSCGHD